ncbi:MAG TPA: hypothetical protein VMW35_06280 [Myxococcota bacterium]|nr:hypothetical protein [Myxococcota bacterium]
MHVFLLLLVVLALTLLWAWRRPNRSRVDPRLDLETWQVVGDGLHNSNTDLVHWHGAFWLVHAASPWHLGSKQCRLVIRRSDDGRVFSWASELTMPGQDIRDPKLVPIGAKLFLYALPNTGLAATPYGTVYSTSEDGLRWESLRPIEIEGLPEDEASGWLLWRPKTRDGVTWLVPAYWRDHGRSILLSTQDGVRFRLVSRIWQGDGNDETDFEFLPDGRILATARLEIAPDSLLGHPGAHTLLATAAPPYERWSYAKSFVARLDGPALFAHDGRVFAVARYQPPPFGRLTRQASALARKRTALYVVEPDRLVHLSDVPSAGDTSYAGVVLREGSLFFSYYTSDVRRDWPWLLGMFLPSEIRMGRVSLTALAKLAEAEAPRA